MLKFNKKTNTLEHDQYTYKLQDVSEPQLYRETFDYNKIPKIPFNHRRVPMQPPEELWITDTTFRDGQQSMPPYTVKQIVDIYDLLHKLGGPKGIIRQCEFFLYSDKDKEAVRECLARGYKYPEVTGWIRAVKEDFKLVKDMGLKETGILTSASDYHIFLKLKKTRRQAMEGYLAVVKSALEIGVIPRCHFEDITRADFYGFVVPFAVELMKLSKESGIPIKIRACDTMGYGVPFFGASLPRCVPGIIYGLRHYAKVPSEQLEWHGHNDFHKVLVNSTFAWLYGCCAANGTLFGFGERTGNPPLEALVIEYISLTGNDDYIDTTVITEIARYYEKEIGIKIPSNYPFVGSDFNVTRAGIHADGIMKDEEIYNVFNTEKLLNRPVKIGITDKSGRAGVAYWVNSYFGLDDNKKIHKNHTGVNRIAKWVESEFANGRITSVSDREMLEQVKRYMPELTEPAEDCER
ncbi:MAG: 2-isopropylmalate synthase [Thermodesulfobacteriota bacterium]